MCSEAPRLCERRLLARACDKGASAVILDDTRSPGVPVSLIEQEDRMHALGAEVLHVLVDCVEDSVLLAVWLVKRALGGAKSQSH